MYQLLTENSVEGKRSTSITGVPLGKNKRSVDKRKVCLFIFFKSYNFSSFKCYTKSNYVFIQILSCSFQCSIGIVLSVLGKVNGVVLGDAMIKASESVWFLNIPACFRNHISLVLEQHEGASQYGPPMNLLKK